MKISELNVLIVEDDEFQRRITSGILDSLGVATVSEAGNGRQALEVIRSAHDPIDVALCDLNMPEMDGMEFLRHLGKENRNISVILTSALDGKLISSVGRMTGLYGVNLLGTIEKPVLLASLEALLSKHDNSPDLKHNKTESVFSLEEIMDAVEADQFEPYFQPKVDLKTGRLIGAEALARWLHPKKGVIGPGAFIPMLEQTNNIDKLTFRILEKSAASCRYFHDLGHLMTVSVNLSLVSLDDTSLADKISDIVRRSGIDPQYLMLEITESAAMTQVAPALENLARLCMNGFSLSIDDFGTGSSNLQQLTRIAFSELKIDQSFVRDFSDNKSLRVVVKSSIDMAHKLNVKSVAEGVETRRDWETLKTVGCDTAQGYLIGKPMDVEAFSEYMECYRPESFATEAVSRPAHKQVKILIVDDDNFARKIIIRVLHDLGYTDIVDAECAESATRLFESNAFDLIVTDVNMPGMNGLQFIQMIRSGKTRAKPGTRIVVLSLFSQTEILGAALALDVNGFLVKPIIPSVVEEKLARAISEQYRPRSPIAYETVKTDPKLLDKMSPKGLTGAAVALSGCNGHGVQVRGRSIALHRLRPGMILAENVNLRDGTLILSAGHALSEVSINRLNDLETLLPANGVAIQEQTI